ncbi:hypothetical protein QZH41_003339 [Actinostola sp. cb2023]|nr:hypothetical protein QZH41_003339 [Actinostola sp. cb2023]
MMEIQTEDVYKDIKAKQDLYDTSDYPKDHFLYSAKNKKVIGKMKDECAGTPVVEFVALRPKMYSELTTTGALKKANGVKNLIGGNTSIQGNATSNSSDVNRTYEIRAQTPNCMLGVANGNSSLSNHSSSAQASTSSGLSNQAKFWLLFVLTVVAFFFMATISPIMDATVVTMTTDVDYGKLRLWGAVGFGLAGLVSGIAANDGKLNAELNEKANFLPSFIMFFVLNALVFVVCLSMKGVEGRKPSDVVLPHIKVLLTDTRVLFFITVVFIMGISSGVITWFLFLFLKDLGGSQSLLGISMAVCCTSEILVFLVSGKMISFLGNTKILFLSLTAFIIRLIAYSYLQDPWLVLPIELLHGFTYAAMWSACVSYATNISPPEVSTTVIGLMTGVHFGLGWGLGGTLGGIVYQYYGPRILFRSCAVMCGVGMAIQVLAETLFRQSTSRN